MNQKVDIRVEIDPTRTEPRVVIQTAETTELVEAYTSAEREIIGNYGFVPLLYKNSYLIASKDNEQIQYDPFTEAVDFRLALNYS